MKLTLRLLPYLFIQFLIVILVGAGELLIMDWGFEKFLDAEFWFGYTTLTLAGILSFFSWANMKINKITSTPYYKGMESNPKVDLNSQGNIVAIKRNSLNELVLKYRTSDLPEFLQEVNLDEKRRRYIFKVTNKLNKLRSKHKPHLSEIKYLESTITDEWLDTNLEHTYVKYVPITEGYIINGIVDKKSHTFRQRSLHKSEKMILDNMHKWILSLSYTLLVTSITFTLNFNLSFAVIYPILIKVGSCVLQGVFGASYAVTYINEKVIYELDDRIAIFEAYLEWKRNKTKEVHVDGDKS